jgi:hypothetical protein
LRFVLGATIDLVAGVCADADWPEEEPIPPPGWKLPFRSVLQARWRKPRAWYIESELLEISRMHGTFAILRTSNAGSTVERYQVRYEDLAGNSFAGNVDSEDLRVLLYDKLSLGLTNDRLDQDYDRLQREGHIVFPEIEMREEELAGAGLTYLPVEG